MDILEVSQTIYSIILFIFRGRVGREKSIFKMLKNGLGRL